MKTLAHIFTTLVISSLLASGCGAAGTTKGTITITTRIDFSAWPRAGSFEVSEGADILGYSAGSFVDTPIDTHVQKLLKCESGTRSGTFTADFVPPENPGPGAEDGPWSIVAGTEGFTGLSGGGDFRVVVDNATASGVETLTGKVGYRP